MEAEFQHHVIHPRSPFVPRWVFDVLLVVVLLAGLYFRTTGLDWDQNEHLHPDERFLTMVATAIHPVENLAEYFNTAESSLNPHNRGYTFFVYGTLPLFIVRYVAEWMGMTGYDQVYLVGRALSGAADLLTVLLVYLIASRLFDRRVGLLAAAFSAFAVLQIQLSHYFTVDTYTNLFTFIAFYFAVRVLLDRTGYPNPRAVRLSYQPSKSTVHSEVGKEGISEASFPVHSVPVSSPAMALQIEKMGISEDKPSLRHFLTPGILYVLFGVGLGLAMASKVSAAPLALLLPAAVLLRLLRLDPWERRQQIIPAAIYLVLAGLVSFLTFRIFQPYAFSGPGFLGILPNERWLDNLRELSNQSHLDADPPFAFQWARRPITFAWTNMVLWGLGFPLGILAWGGFIWMGWRIMKGSWYKHTLIWGWTLIYFSWQALNWVRSMRYQLLVYPTLAIIAAWAIVALWDRRQVKLSANGRPSQGKWLRPAAGILGAVVLASTFGWAFAFTRIYSTPVTRVEASSWVYQNVPGPVNIQVETHTGMTNVPLAVRKSAELTREIPYPLIFQPHRDGYLAEITLPYVEDRNSSAGEAQLRFELISSEDPGTRPVLSTIHSRLSSNAGSQGSALTVPMNMQEPLQAGKQYLLRITLVGANTTVRLRGAPVLTFVSLDEQQLFRQSLPIPVQTFTRANPYRIDYRSQETGTIRQITIPHLVDQSAHPGTKSLRLGVENQSGGVQGSATANADVQSEFGIGEDPRGSGYTFTLDQPVPVSPGDQVSLTFRVVGGDGEFAMRSSAAVIEEPWDDPIPVGLGRYSPYDDLYGIYRNDLNVVMYTDDNQEKLNRLSSVLDQADYVFITSNRQWGSTTRVPERYPLTTEYYRSLLGCPNEQSVSWCYSVAKPGMFTSKLGFELVEIFQSNPRIGSWEINDQFAEEAFTVYDHPKVLIFQKTPAYDRDKVSAVLGGVDLDMVMRLTPRRVTGLSFNLMLPTERLTVQREGGTWSDLFNPQALQNRLPALGLVVWYLMIWLMGIVTYPLVRLALPGLQDRGYPLARIAGMLLLSYLVWLAGSFGLVSSRTLITLLFGGMVLLGLALAYRQRKELAVEWQRRKGYFLAVELIALAFFTLDLLIRLGNPDLWHPSYGGERPMNFSYFNAIIKSSTFPPYDPWFAGGFINYYYYGYVMVGVITKWLGIIPSVAYNLILPTLFSLLALGAFSLGWNLISAQRRGVHTEQENSTDPEENQAPGYPLESRSRLMAQSDDDTESALAEAKDPRGEGETAGLFSVFKQTPFKVGLTASLALVVLGNLGTLRMLWHGWQRLVAPNGMIDGANIFTRLVWTVKGLFLYVSGVGLPYGTGDWYWKPSRVIPAPNDVEPITEFPFFTFLYSDLHAHMIALPITVLALTWVLSVVLAKAQWGEWNGRNRVLSAAAGFLLGGLAIGSLRPTNTWDFPTYLLLGILALGYTQLRYSNPNSSWLPQLPTTGRRIAAALVSAGLLVGLTFLFFQPYAMWYRQGYNAVDLWKGTHTPFWSYLTHWGLFLFVILSWMLWETRRWLATTPASALRKLQPYQGLILALMVAVIAAIIILTASGAGIAWFVLPIAIWAGILVLRPNLPEAKRLVLFLVAMGLGLTLFVEVFVLRGDIGRMNTVFKFYLQVWTFFAIAAAVGLGWLVQGLKDWQPRWFPVWEVGLILLIAGAALFPMLGGMAKIRDRMAPQAPRSLDSMAFMSYATYYEEWGPMDLSQDYRAIRWMHENVYGSPVIVEANLSEYRWGSRFSIYTGLPGVVGWNWHQRQQRAVVPSLWVTDRVQEVEDFYRTTKVDAAEAFLNKYEVEYIILGQQERGKYPGPGLDKFVTYAGTLWDEVYRDGETVIYQVKCDCAF